MRAPANNFWIARRDEKALAHLLHIAKQGIGWYRRHEKPETIDELLYESGESDLTGDMLGKIRKVALHKSISLDRMLLKESLILIAHLTALSKGRVSIKVLQRFSARLQYDLKDLKGPDVLCPEVIEQSGFGKEQLGKKIWIDEERSDRVLIFPVYVGSSWISVQVDKSRSTVTVSITGSQDATRVERIVREWNARASSGCVREQPVVQVEVREGNVLSWLLATMFAEEVLPDQNKVDRFVAQTILRGT